MITFSYACSYPWAVVIMYLNARLAIATVERARWFHYVACATNIEHYFLSLYDCVVLRLPLCLASSSSAAPCWSLDYYILTYGLGVVMKHPIV